ncbi:SWI/SNF chromatin-remodeling complex subunit snf5 [Colletotrichum chlorophyti]|uniref:SWI/SNF chromatin-remodeling complex subunit snf5 n=1 Tax=Colletotrichum chlorophyti TaxID=708187 RepID=A0A1Q8RVU4_9PEZI|nr:SWI/SNF chromatin-remodeling complex subunit snf5 [Colletotrichum chlorophyti]
MAAQPSTSTPTAPGATASSSASASASAANDRDGTPQAPGSKSLPVRDRDSFNKLQVERYITRDWHHSVAMKDAQERFEKDMQEMRDKIDDYTTVKNQRMFFPPSKLYGEGYRGFGNGYTDIDPRMRAPFPAQVIYPSQKPRPGKRLSHPLRWKKKDLKKQAEQHEELVPIRIDVDWEKIKLRDTFTWNLHDRLIPAELFAQHLVEDIGIPLDAAHKPVLDQVIAQMRDQLNDFYPLVFSEEDALDPELPYSAYKNDEMRILIKLNVTVGPHTLVDQFEWDINNPLNSPEEFAASMARDLSLSGEFTTAIAHSIREQCQLFARSLYSVGHPFDGRPVEDPDLVAAFLPSPLPTVFRPQQQAKDYAPYLYELSDADLERNEVIFSREQRRQKRSINRRGGPQLPDLKERQRTIRTLLVSSVLPGAATNMEETSLYKRVAGAPSTRKRPGARDGEISDSDDSEDSGPDSPGVSQLTGTARTRGLRGAASAAQQRITNLGRSETPEASIVHHHETRRNVGRFGRETRDETEEPTQLIVTLKVSKDKLKRLLQNPRSRATPSGSQTPSTPAHARIPSAAAAAAASSMPPPSTPASNSQSQPALPQGQIGRQPAPPPVAGQPPPPPPPPPEWLKNCLLQLKNTYTYDNFEGIMKYSAVNPDTETIVPVPAGSQPPENVRWMFLPRIRCLDCPGKLYTPGPEMTAGNFEVHLRNKQHRQKVDAREGRDTTPTVNAAAS